MAKVELNWQAGGIGNGKETVAIRVFFCDRITGLWDCSVGWWPTQKTSKESALVPFKWLKGKP